MSSKVNEITITITNSQPFNAAISIFGSDADPKANTVNTHTLYAWNISGQSYVGLTVFQIQYKKVGASSYITKSMPIPTNFADVVRILNLQGIGTFWFDTLLQKIYIGSDTYVYNQLSIA